MGHTSSLRNLLLTTAMDRPLPTRNIPCLPACHPPAHRVITQWKHASQLVAGPCSVGSRHTHFLLSMYQHVLRFELWPPSAADHCA